SETRRRFDAFPFSAPTGLRLIAQGCRATATLGTAATRRFTPTGLRHGKVPGRSFTALRPDFANDPAGTFMAIEKVEAERGVQAASTCHRQTRADVPTSQHLEH